MENEAYETIDLLEVLNAVRNAGYTVISVGKEGGEHSDTAKK